jgi:hypothetical protein
VEKGRLLLDKKPAGERKRLIVYYRVCYSVIMLAEAMLSYPDTLSGCCILFSKVVEHKSATQQQLNRYSKVGFIKFPAVTEAYCHENIMVSQLVPQSIRACEW